MADHDKKRHDRSAFEQSLRYQAPRYAPNEFCMDIH